VDDDHTIKRVLKELQI